MFNLLGLKPEDIQKMGGTLQGAFSQMQADMACVKDQLAAIQRTLEYEFGRPRRDLQGHDPARMPLVAQVAVGAGEARAVDVTGLLGKPATRGHIVNIGDTRAALWFSFGPQRVGPYILLPAAALDLSFALEVLEVGGAGEGPAVVQILFQ
ncbi:hypothetical protein [Thermus phage P23-77]|uniref:Uncharacterized protein n=1 Tax=Thermus virus P23-77 TaxID=1714272 RepID=C8CHM5_9VIRU|nr:hypothetical protein P23-77_gp29 [Thermus phage P23-77]ACV05054.1 hypothetical protein [Thermus phage P23-77]